jgi:hypothetical protein
MDYLRVYNQIVERAKAQSRSKGGNIYYESHHIIPKCVGGSDKKENRVLLTAREHYICHALLFKANPESRKLAHAFYLMCNFSKEKGRNYRVSSRLYEDAKLMYVKYRKVKQKEDVKKYWTEERRQRRSREYSKEGNPNYGKVGSFSGDKNPMRKPEVREKIRIARLGKPMSEEAIRKSVNSKRSSGAYLKLSCKMKKPILNLETGVVYPSRAEAALVLNCHVSTVDEKRKKGLLKHI